MSYTLDEIKSYLKLKDSIQVQCMNLAIQIAQIRKAHCPIGDYDWYINEYTVLFKWEESEKCGCCSGYYELEFPTLYLICENPLETEKILMKQKEESRRLEELAEKEIKEKNRRESELLQLRKLKEKYEGSSVELSP